MDTVWPEILAGNLFWRIGGFESNIYFIRDCRLEYNFNFEDMSIAFSDLPTFCDHCDTFFIQICSVEAELRACEDW